MRPRSAPAGAAATAAAHRSAGKASRLPRPVVRACEGVGDRPFSLCEERIGVVPHGKRRSKNPPRQDLPGLVRQVAPQGSGEEKEESSPGQETLMPFATHSQPWFMRAPPPWLGGNNVSGERRGGSGRRRPCLAREALADDLQRRTL